MSVAFCRGVSNYDQQFRGMIKLREALAESSNAVAVWLTGEIGIGSVLGTPAI